MAAWTIDYLDVGDFIAVALHQRRQKAMQAVEIRQREERVAPKRLEAAAGIAGAVAQDRVAHRVGNARLQAFESGGPAPDPLTGDEAETCATGLERAHQRREERR